MRSGCFPIKYIYLFTFLLRLASIYHYKSRNQSYNILSVNHTKLFQQYDQKNIRRRVYDALNVLMAMNIISKEKKLIKWLGLPTNSIQECLDLVKEKKDLTERIRSKTHQLHELLMQVSWYYSICFNNNWMQKSYGYGKIIILYPLLL